MYSDQPILTRLQLGITQHFTRRVSDWLCAVILLNFGVILLRHDAIFPSSVVYTGLARLADQSIWGGVCVTIALLRIGALVLNGTFPQITWTPMVRAMTAGLSCFAWTQIAFGSILGTDAYGLEHMPYKYVLLFDIYNVWLAAREAREANSRVDHHVRQGV